jgi:uncharacterized RDD family membrane protein YckC
MEMTSQPPLSGLLRRFCAILLEGLVVGLLSLPMALGAYLIILDLMSAGGGGTMMTLGVFMTLLAGLALQSYSALVLGMWAYGLTPGKWMLGIRVVKQDTGLPAGFWRMVLRQTIGQWAAAVLCYIGFLWAVIDSNKQGWNDKIAKTLVVRTR